MISQFSSKIQSGNSSQHRKSVILHRDFAIASFPLFFGLHNDIFLHSVFFSERTMYSIAWNHSFWKKGKQWLMYFVSPGNTLCCELVIAVMSICLAIISKVTFSSMFKEESTWPCVNVPICRQVSSLALLKMNHNCWAKSTLLFSISM